MTETTARIRWDDEAPRDGDVYIVAHIGYAGTIQEPAFMIYTPDEMHAEWLLSARLVPGSQFFYADTPEDLKAEAERWLEQFVSSLGAVFPDEPKRPSRAWHADWTEVDRDSSGNAILRHKPTGGRYKILPVEEC